MHTAAVDQGGNQQQNLCRPSGEGQKRGCKHAGNLAAVWVLPEAARCIAEHLGRMEVDFAILVVIGGGVPVRLGYDDTVGQNGQGILDDWHLQGIT